MGANDQVGAQHLKDDSDEGDVHEVVGARHGGQRVEYRELHMQRAQHLVAGDPVASACVAGGASLAAGARDDIAAGGVEVERGALPIVGWLEDKKEEERERVPASGAGGWARGGRDGGLVTRQSTVRGVRCE